MLTKKKLLSAIKDMPDNFTMEELQDHVLFVHKVETGLAQSAAGKVTNTALAKLKLKKSLMGK